MSSIEKPPDIGMEASTAARESLRTHIVTELVIFSALFGVGEHIVGFGSFLELLLGLLVARILVGVILDGLLSVSAFDSLFVGILVDSKHFVVISFSSHETVL